MERVDHMLNSQKYPISLVLLAIMITSIIGATPSAFSAPATNFARIELSIKPTEKRAVSLTRLVAAPNETRPTTSWAYQCLNKSFSCKAHTRFQHCKSSFLSYFNDYHQLSLIAKAKASLPPIS